VIAGASCSLTVKSTPQTTGVHLAALSIASDATTSLEYVSLIATGVTGTAPHLTVTPSSLAFGSIALGASSNLSFAITNTGTTPASGVALTLTGDYAITTPCSQTALPAAGTCTVQVTFTPSATGVRPGSLQIASSDPNSPLALPLSGTGISTPSFILTVDGGPTATQTVATGSTAKFALLVTPTGNFNNSIALTCTPLQSIQFASCSLSPSLLSPTTQPTPASASVTTLSTSTTSAKTRPGLPHPQTLTLLFASLLATFRFRKKLPPRLSFAVLSLFATIVLSNCGSSNSSDLDLNYTPPGSYQFKVTAISGSNPTMAQTVTFTIVVNQR
jgi:trimeric autotransporter adhesin